MQLRPKQVFTSYFAGYHGDHGVSIARSAPRGWHGRELKMLAPSRKIINLPPAEYIPAYQAEVFDQVDEKTVLSRIHDGDVLLCWEKPEEFCHRHLVADWLTERGVEVEELGLGKGLFG